MKRCPETAPAWSPLRAGGIVKPIGKVFLTIAVLAVVVAIGISSHSSLQVVSAEPVSTPAATPFYAEGGPFGG
jgi:hypothetical protein